MFANPQDLLENHGESSLSARGAFDRAQTAGDFPQFGEADKNGDIPPPPDSLTC